MYKNKRCKWAAALLLVVLAGSSVWAQQDTLRLPDPPISRVYLWERGDSTEYIPDGVYLDVPDGSTILVSPRCYDLLLLHKAAMNAGRARLDSAQAQFDSLVAANADSVIGVLAGEKAVLEDSLVAVQAQRTLLEQTIDQMRADRVRQIEAFEQLLEFWQGGF